MDLRLCLLLQLALLSMASANLVFDVHNKFKGRDSSLRDLKAHDVSRHGRSLSAVQFPMAGSASPYKAGLYFTKIGLGSPSKDYYVQVDTASDFLSVNCEGCNKCPTKSNLGFVPTLYDPSGSSSAKMIRCDHDFCTSKYLNTSQIPSCKSDKACSYDIVHQDGSKIKALFVEDNILLHQMSGDLGLSSMTETVVFGCGVRESEEPGSSDAALDGTLGLGLANSSIISQLAAAGKTKKMFAHCLDNKKGGGIFTIGEVVEPEINMIPIIPNRTHYGLVLKDIEVGSEVLQTPADTFDAGNSREVIFDSGITLTYLPDDIYDALTAKINSQVRHGATLTKFDGATDSFACFSFKEEISRIVQNFPTVKFNFEKSVSLTVHPSDYLFPIREDALCAGWQPGGIKTKNGKSTIILGVMALANKMVVYNLGDRAIGWTDYDCSASTAKVKDKAGAVHEVKAQDISPAASHNCGSLLLLMLIVMAFNPLY